MIGKSSVKKETIENYGFFFNIYESYVYKFFYSQINKNQYFDLQEMYLTNVDFLLAYVCQDSCYDPYEVSHERVGEPRVCEFILLDMDNIFLISTLSWK